MNPFTNPLDHLLADIRQSLPMRAAEQLDRLSDSYGYDLLNLRLVPPEDILSKEEQQLLAEIEAEPPTTTALSYPSLVIILKATRLCNLRCVYCNSWRAGPGQVMDFKTLTRLMYSTLRAPALRKLQIVWHGGEVTLLPTDYVRKALWLQERYRDPQTDINNCIQTNGTILTSDWVRFLKVYRISVGVSVDASPELHDQRRRTKAGRGSWQATMRGIDLLRAENVPFGILAVVDEHAIAIGAEAFLEQLDLLNVRGVALLNALPSNEQGTANSEAYLDWNSFQTFMREAFEVWWSRYRRRFEIRELQALVDAVRGRSHGLCIYAGNCMGRYLTVEPDGQTSACEKYVGNPAYAFGSLHDGGIPEILAKSQNVINAIAVVDSQKKSSERACNYYRYCQGGCPHDDLNNRRFGAYEEGCCGMRGLLDDILATVGKETTDGYKRTSGYALGLDIRAGLA